MSHCIVQIKISLSDPTQYTKVQEYKLLSCVPAYYLWGGEKRKSVCCTKSFYFIAKHKTNLSKKRWRRTRGVLEEEANANCCSCSWCCIYVCLNASVSKWCLMFYKLTTDTMKNAEDALTQKQACTIHNSISLSFLPSFCLSLLSKSVVLWWFGLLHKMWIQLDIPSAQNNTTCLENTRRRRETDMQQSTNKH